MMMSLNKTNYFMIFISFIFVLSNLTSSSVAETIDVCSSGCQYNSIQYAINNAKDGDKIYVKDGVYKEHVVLNDKSVILMGENRDTTIIDGSGSGICITVREKAFIHDFTLKNCQGIDIYSSEVTITGTKIFGIPSGRNIGSTGIYINGGSVKIYENIIQNSNSGIFLHTNAEGKIYDNIIRNNDNGIFLGNARKSVIFENIIELNRDNGVRVDNSWGTTIFKNNIADNKNSGISVLSSSVNTSYNHLSGNWNGIYLQSSENCLINNNNFTSNHYGIYLKSGGENTIQYNRFRENSDADIFLGISKYNTVKHNSACNIESTESNDIGYNICPDDPLELPDQKAHSEEIIHETKENTSAKSKRITVCYSGCQFNTIQDAINNAKDNDEIYVEEGVYKEHLVLNDKSITIRGESRDSTIIDGEGHGSCIDIASHSNVLISEITLQNCNGIAILVSSKAVVYQTKILGLGHECLMDSEASRFGIFISNSSAKIYDNIIQNNHRGIIIAQSDNNKLYDNHIEDNCYGVFLSQAKRTKLFRNAIQLNHDSGIFLETSWDTNIFENDIINNTGSGIYVSASSINASHNNLTGNSNGIYLMGGWDSLINNNSFVSNRNGIILESSWKNTIEYNIFRCNQVKDISFSQSENNDVGYNYACNIAYTESNNIENNKCLNDSVFCVKTKTSVIKDDKKDNVIIEESDAEEDIIGDLFTFLFLIVICIFIYRKNKRKKEELKRKKMEEEIRKKLKEKRRKKEKEDIRRKKEEEEEKRKKLEEEKHKKEEDEKRKFEEKQRAKGLVKYKNDIWLKPKALEHLKKIELGLNNNFKDYTPYDFEKFIAKLFEKMGYFCNVTKKTGDFGVDVVARKGKDTIVIQAKKYKHGNNVGNVDVQKILGAMWKYEANKAIVVTTSDFTVQAESQAKGAPVELWDRHTLHDMVKFYFIDKEIGRMTNNELEEDN